MASGGNGNSPFAWLGLLKWSLAYSDGTRSSDDIVPMSKEDIEFLEKVMKEGIIDEGERMKSILRDLTDSLEGMLGLSPGGGDAGGTKIKDEANQENRRKELEEDEMLELLQELRDIVEQIDYARAFMAMGGIPFLLGCATSPAGVESIPISIRKGALSVLATMCQNNPPVQLGLLEHGHMPPLIQLFYDYSPSDENKEGDDSMREKVVQALSCSIRGHAMAEHIFCQNEQGIIMLQLGLGVQSASKPSTQLRKRCLFLLRALLTADDADNSRLKPFQSAIAYIATHEINHEKEKDAEIREMSLQLLTQMLRFEPQPSPNNEGSAATNGSSLGKLIILKYRNEIVALGIRRIQEIRNLKEGSEEKEFATLELEEWESLMVALAEVSSSFADAVESSNENNQ